MKNLIVLLLLLSTLNFCTYQHKSNLSNGVSIKPSTLIFDQGKKLNGEPIGLNVLLNDPMQILMVDSILLVSDFGEFLIKVVDPISGKELNRICRKGRGPGEFSDRIKVAYNKHNNAFHLYEEQVRKFAQFPKSQAFNWTNDSVSKIQFDKHLMRVVKCNDSLFVGAGLLEKRYALFNSEGKFIRDKYDYPDLSGKNWPFDLMSIAYQNDLIANSIGNRLVEASLYCDNIEFFAVKGTDIDKIMEYQSYSPDLENQSGENMRILQPKEDTKFGYLDICAQGEHVYCLYSGKTIKESRGTGGPFQGSTIRVFDFNGNPVISYKLDRDVFKFTVDTLEKSIYAIVHNPEPQIVRFRL